MSFIPLHDIRSAAHLPAQDLHPTLDQRRRLPPWFKVKIRQGEVQNAGGNSNDPGTPPRAAPSLRPIPMELGDSLRDIGDPELRTVLESLARSMSAVDDRKD